MENGIMRSPEVIALVGVSRTTLWRMERDGIFPKRVQVSVRAVGWRREMVEKWIQDRQEVA